ncbi:MAG: S8 family serine peptidase [Phycisphaerales bacterium]|nr:S8 family serine peptidase [Phycisphaerales bacterium]
MHPRPTPRTRPGPARLAAARSWALALVLACGTSLADDSTLQPVRTGRGTLRLTPQSLDARTTIARPDPRLARPKGQAAPADLQPAFLLHSRVITRGADARVLREFGRVRAIPGAPGFHIIECATVAAAAQAGEAILSRALAAEAYVDCTPPASARSIPTDPDLGLQWHLINTINPAADANIEGAWLAGYDGAGQVIGIIDVGQVQFLHPDLSANYLGIASIISAGSSAHSTSVAGVAAARGNNGLGGVGAAYMAQFGTMVEGSATQNAAAFAHRNDIISIKNNSWGPFDDGTITQMTSAEYAAIETAATTGRSGKGVIFVWAAGNGGSSDRVDYDPYASSRYVVPVSAINDADVASVFNEQGACTLISAPTSGTVPAHRRIFTTDLTGAAGASPTDYTNSFGGTSAAAPLVSGVIALMLEANPDLTWRDVQRVLVESARHVDPASTGWSVNGAGYDIHHAYGFGAVDASAAVALAETWPGLPAEASQDSGVFAVNAPIPDDDSAGVSETITMPAGIRIESVEVILNVESEFLGDLEITLVSPEGTASTLARARTNDGGDGLTDQVFTVRRCLGEHGAGEWTLTIADQGAADLSTWLDWRLVLHGTPFCPGDFTGASDPGDPAYGLPDSVVDAADFFYFLDQFALGNLGAADLTGSSDPNDPSYGTPDGTLDAADFFYYLDAFVQGC